MAELNADSGGFELESLTSSMSAASGVDAEGFTLEEVVPEGFALEKDAPPAEPSEMACGFDLTLTEDAWQPTHPDDEGFQLDDSSSQDEQCKGLTTRSKIGASCKRWSYQSRHVCPRPTAQ